MRLKPYTFRVTVKQILFYSTVRHSFWISANIVLLWHKHKPEPTYIPIIKISVYMHGFLDQQQQQHTPENLSTSSVSVQMGARYSIYYRHCVGR